MFLPTLASSVRPKIRFRPVSAENKSFGFGKKLAELSAPAEIVFRHVSLFLNLITIK
jgi:hypothetical protein